MSDHSNSHTLNRNEVQPKYLEYQKEYVNEFDKTFFRKHMREEWFRERYDPVFALEAEKSTSQWAAAQSQVFQTSLVQNPGYFLTSVSLDAVNNNNEEGTQTVDGKHNVVHDTLYSS